MIIVKFIFIQVQETPRRQDEQAHHLLWALLRYNLTAHKACRFMYDEFRIKKFYKFIKFDGNVQLKYLKICR